MDSSSLGSGLLATAVSGAALFALLATVVLPTRAAANDGEPRCGAPGAPACPMQRHMRAELAAPYSEGELERLATALEALVEQNPRPRQWNNWRSFCDQGARAARAGNPREAVIACTNCHKIYRRAYNVSYRRRSLPR